MSLVPEKPNGIKLSYSELRNHWTSDFTHIKNKIQLNGESYSIHQFNSMLTQWKESRWWIKYMPPGKAEKKQFKDLRKLDMPCCLRLLKALTLSPKKLNDYGLDNFRFLISCVEGYLQYQKISLKARSTPLQLQTCP